jgi:hypothetical protein
MVQGERDTNACTTIVAIKVKPIHMQGCVTGEPIRYVPRLYGRQNT